MSGDLTALAQAMLGPDVAVAAGKIADLQGVLWPSEAVLMTRARAVRLADFTAGRTAARQALAMLTEPSRPILQGGGGEPVWPEGITGSLTHGGDLCLASLGRTGQFRSLGVDLEPIAALDDTLVAEICSVSERHWIATQSDAAALPLRIFSAKEATYKALYPLTGTVFDFGAIIISLTEKRDGFSAELTRDIGPFTAGATFHGQQGSVRNTLLSTLKILSTPL